MFHDDDMGYDCYIEGQIFASRLEFKGLRGTHEARTLGRAASRPKATATRMACEERQKRRTKGNLKNRLRSKNETKIKSVC